MVKHLSECPIAQPCPVGWWGATQHWTVSARASKSTRCNNCRAACHCPVEVAATRGEM